MKRNILIAVAVALAVVAAWYHFTQKSSDTVDAGGKTYVGHSLDECSRIRFVCVEGKEYFADDKGCGCQPISE